VQLILKILIQLKAPILKVKQEKIEIL